MNSNANYIAGVCFVLLTMPIMLLAILEKQFFAGLVGSAVMLVFAYAFFRKAGADAYSERINRRIFKGNLG